jgi:DNA gyrase/topoisomerase IV subunit B
MSRMEIDNAMKAENIKDYDILRLKGWGECSADQLAEFCLNPETRKLKQLQWTEETESMLNKTMGNDVAFRKILLGIEQ